MAVFLLFLANFRVKTGVKKVTHREFQYWASSNEPAIYTSYRYCTNPNQSKKLCFFISPFFYDGIDTFFPKLSRMS